MERTLRTDIIILGAGIGGYETFRTLSKLLKKYRRNEKILLVDRNNYFTFTPMLHEAAAGSIEPDHAAIPLRELVYGTGHNFLQAEVLHIDPVKKSVQTSRGAIEYGVAVVALGSGVNYFGIAGAAEHSYTVRTLAGALKLRRKLISLLENCAESVAITIVGGGFSGVEVAGQLAHLAKHDLKKLYPDKTLSIKLVEAGPAVVAIMPTEVQKLVAKRLGRNGVEIRTGTGVTSVGENSLLLASGEHLASDMTIWCAGVANYADKILPPELVSKGRIPVNEWLEFPTQPSLFAVGDIAYFFNHNESSPVPQLGEAAHRQGTFVAKRIVARLLGRRMRPFSFHSTGWLMPIGEWYGVLVRGHFILFGFWAWVIRRAVYLHFMPGTIRKLKIISDWTLHGLGFRYILELEEQDRDVSDASVFKKENRDSNT